MPTKLKVKNENCQFMQQAEKGLTAGYQFLPLSGKGFQSQLFPVNSSYHTDKGWEKEGSDYQIATGVAKDGLATHLSS